MLSSTNFYAALPAKDFERAKAFYQEKLGLKIEEENPGGIYFTSGNTKILVYPSTFAGTNQATAGGWEVPDIEAEVKELKSKGIEFEEYDMPEIKTQNGIATLGDTKSAWFKDSEGNILAISQPS